MLQLASLDAPRSASEAANYRPDIDGLRAIAVLAVVGYHAFPAWFPGGFIGVDIFFVISGYLISGHIFALLDMRLFSLRNFYSRRIRRIFPALFTVLFVSLTFGWFVLLADEYLQLGKHVAAGAGFVSNLALWHESGYFDNTAATKPLLHLWSLGVEEQFYIFWPLMAWGIWRLRVNLLAWIILVGALSFALNINFMTADPVLDFYSPFTRFWELLAGAALVQSERDRGFSYSPVVSNVQAGMGAGLLLWAFAFVRESMPFPGWVAIPVVLGSVVLIAAGPKAFFNRIVLSWRPAVAVGLISYSLYLWHWPLLSFARIIEGEMPSREIRVGIVIATFVLAAATFLYIEKPIRHGRYLKWKTVGSLAAMISVALAGLCVYWLQGMPNRPSIVAMAEANQQFASSIWRFSANDTCLDRYPYPEAETYSYWFCITNKDSPPDVILLGSSFANHLYPGFVGNDLFAGKTVLSIGTCPPMMAPISSERANNAGPCNGDRWFKQQEFIKDIIAQGSAKLVVMDGILLGGHTATPAQVERIREWVDFIESAGAQVAIFTPHVFPPSDIKGCFSRPLRPPQKSCAISEDEIATIQAQFQPVIDAIKSTNPRVWFFDQNEVFCLDGSCSFILDGKPMIRDESGHYSEFASSVVARLFATFAKQHGIRSVLE